MCFFQFFFADWNSSSNFTLIDKLSFCKIVCNNNYSTVWWSNNVLSLKKLNIINKKDKSRMCLWKTNMVRTLQARLLLALKTKQLKTTQIFIEAIFVIVVNQEKARNWINILEKFYRYKNKILSNKHLKHA